ncbi:MAG: CDP-alcohol phosphatidyltransferase family protein [Thermomicrobiales bacterium]|nr:CDP-alcohol phosphatidyltransferase family protein [Thermomicrobiales bacterium]
MGDAERQARRPVPARDTGWAHRTAPKLQRLGLTPNQISVASVVFAAVAAAGFVASAHVAAGPRIVLLLIAAAMMPLRLLCNLFDGMLAVEGGLKSPLGGIYNELPDRFADLLFIAGAGYAVADFTWGRELGWAAAAFSLIVPYVRALGVTLGTPQFYDGPMAKPRRMHILVAACLLSVIEVIAGWPRGAVLAVALAVILIGEVLTIVNRLRLIAAHLTWRGA